jgi:hypothetical protein
MNQLIKVLTVIAVLMVSPEAIGQDSLITDMAKKT